MAQYFASTSEAVSQREQDHMNRVGAGWRMYGDSEK